VGNPLAVGGDHAGQRAGRNGQADEIVGAKLEVGGAGRADRIGQRHAREVLDVLARGPEDLDLLASTAAELDLETGPGETHGETGAPGACSHDRRAADRRQAAQPLPLKHHARPDAVGDRGGEARRGVGGLGEAQRLPGPDAHLVRADAPPAAHGLGADHGDGDHGGATLLGEPPDAASRSAERARPDPRALGEDQHDVAASQDRLRRVDHVRVRGPALDGKGAQSIQHPGLEPAREELLLGDVVHRPPRHGGDHERIEKTAVVGRDDHGTVGGNVLPADPAEAEVDVEERLKDRPHQPVDERIRALLPRTPVKCFVIHCTLAYPTGRGPLQLRS
jgi:hypothetical protein